MTYDEFLCKFLKSIDEFYEKKSKDLKIVLNHEDYGLTERRFELFFENAVNDGYFLGIEIQEDPYSGNLTINSSNPRLSSHGIYFLEKNCKF